MKNISLKTFLKTYTAISNKFIDEYYKFYELCENKTFGINAELIIKYLEYNDSKKFYERLRKNYKIEIDFIIKRKIQNHKKMLEILNICYLLIVLKKFVWNQELKKVKVFVIILSYFVNLFIIISKILHQI